MRNVLHFPLELDVQTSVCTLFEGDYHLGVAALVNSLIAAGYTGTVWAGYRGALPPWARRLQRMEGEHAAYQVVEGVRIVFVPLKTELHLGCFKPRFMLDLLAGPASDCDFLWYFDPDICLRTSWTFFKRWQTRGVVLCEEINNCRLSARDPLRCEWMEIGAEMGLGEPRAITGYFNSGMVAIARSQAGLLDLWERIVHHAGQMGFNLKVLMAGNREMPFHAVDQDALNMALMYVDYPLSTMGPEGMGFAPGEVGVYHAMGPKPWRGSILLRALAGNPPSNAFKFFFTQVSAPIRAYSSIRLCLKRFSCAVAAFIGRFYSRR